MSDTNADVAALGARVAAISESVSEIKVMLTKIISVSETVAALQVQQSQHESTFERAFESIHRANTGIQTVAANAERKHDELQKAFAQFQRDTEAIINQGKGAGRALAAVWAVVGVVVIALFGWTAKEAVNLRDEVSQLKGAVSTLAAQKKP